MKIKEKSVTSAEAVAITVVVGLIVGGLTFIIMGMSMISYGSYVSQKPACDIPYISPPYQNHPRAINFPVCYGWNKIKILFTDYGLDGTLDIVEYKDQIRHVADPNSPDWKIWTERYLEAREITAAIAATVGEKK